MSALPASYDAWRSSGPPEHSYPRGVEDRMGERVVVGQNRYGLGRWGTIVSFFAEKEWDDDHGCYQAVYYEVEFADDEKPTSATLDEIAVQDQLG